MFSILLRVLLIISLVLNGSGYAVASTHMQMGHMDTAVLAPPSAAERVATAEPPCHQDQHNSASASAAQLPDTAPAAAPGKSKHPAPDCCKFGACSCACVHQAQAAVPAYSLRYTVIEHAGVVRPMQPGHVAPTLPHLIRPPIG
ncbi:MAG TPA: CopL family metal-binding regulatory protein [Luteimonas sp.]|nr:CopL family metal-binding regulatory protein [Luteimonas sp.]